jgi:hypothetical protein
MKNLLKEEYLRLIYQHPWLRRCDVTELFIGLFMPRWRFLSSLWFQYGQLSFSVFCWVCRREWPCTYEFRPWFCVEGDCGIHRTITRSDINIRMCVYGIINVIWSSSRLKKGIAFNDYNTYGYLCCSCSLTVPVYQMVGRRQACVRTCVLTSYLGSFLSPCQSW